MTPDQLGSLVYSVTILVDVSVELVWYTYTMAAR
jgi:hypothetical protein